jgi:hypothetical protein
LAEAVLLEDRGDDRKSGSGDGTDLEQAKVGGCVTHRDLLCRGLSS